MREKYANRIWWFLCCYTLFILILVVIDAFCGTGFDVPENVLVTLAGSTVVAAIGLVGIVAKGLFEK